MPQKNVRGDAKSEETRYRRTQGVLDVKLSRTNFDTRSGLGGINTSETGTENAPRGANNVPAAARKRSKLRHNISDVRTPTLIKHPSCSDAPLQTHVCDLSYPLYVFTETCCRSLYNTMQFFIVAQKRHGRTSVFKYICRYLPVKTQQYYSTVKMLSEHRH